MIFVSSIEPPVVPIANAPFQALFSERGMIPVAVEDR